MASGPKKHTFVDRSGRVHHFGKGTVDSGRDEKGAESRPSASRGAPSRPSSKKPRFEEKKDLLPDAGGRRFKPNKKKKHGRGGEDRRQDFRPKSKFERPRSEKSKFEKPKFGASADRRPGTRKFKANVDKNRKGFAFLIFESRELEDAFVPPREAENLFPGDRVEVTVDSRDQVVDLRVLAHRFREVVGKYVAHPTGKQSTGWVVYEQKRAREEIFIPEPGTFVGAKRPSADDWVRVKLHFHEKGPHRVTGEVLDVYGPELPPSADVGMIAAEFNLIEEHSEASEREALTHKLEVPGKDLEGRDDLRKVPFITIDGETARDFDDAVYVERSKSGYILWVAIADVSHYVTEGSELDRDARSRGTSVYFPERAFHMLPRALSENLCSLKPNEPRLAMVAKMHFDRNGTIERTELMEAVIESHRRATYNQIQEEWEKNKKNADWEFHPHFELFAELKKVRHKRGSIDFDLPEAELIVKPTGEVVSIRMRERLDAHRLIEEFMIAANEAVTEWIMKKNWPFVYRVHEEPSMEALEKFQKLAATVGVKVSIDRAEAPSVMADLVRRLEGHPAQAMLNMALLRSLKQAIYSSTHGIHYGLASNAYTHFTSPIRRYPDLVVHRLLRSALRTEKKILKPLRNDERERLEADLADACEHCSYRERLASDAERESIKLKQVRAMMPHVGDDFEAKVVGMIEMGLFVQVRDPYSEGMVNRETMMDDFYIFNEERMVFFGRRKRRTFKMGDPVRAKVLRADVERRQIDFGLVDGEGGERGNEPIGGLPTGESTIGVSGDKRNAKNKKHQGAWSEDRAGRSSKKDRKRRQN